MVKLCVLEADILRAELSEQYVGYGEMFKTLFATSCSDLSVDTFSVIRGEYPEPGQRYDAYLITGSKHDAFSDEAWVLKLREFVVAAFNDGRVLVGICFGHQLIALALGGRVGRSSRGWGLGVHRYAIQGDKPWMSPSVANLDLLVSHQDQVLELPSDAETIAVSSFCPYAGFVIGEQVLCFQAHPEFTVAYLEKLLLFRKAMLSSVVYEQALYSMGRPHQGDVVSQWIIGFIVGGQRSKHSYELTDQP